MLLKHLWESCRYFHLLFLLKFIMCLGVRLTTALLGERFAADTTLVGSLPRVGSLVPCEIFFRMEGLVTHVTGVTAHPPVVGLVGSVFHTVSELFPTKLAKDGRPGGQVGGITGLVALGGFLRGAAGEVGASFATPCAASDGRFETSFGTVSRWISSDGRGRG